jgi:diguanylate cyclase (GGDEF)-like protein
MIESGSSEQKNLFATSAEASRLVLVAEDDAVYRCLLERLLQRASFQVVTVNNGLAALEAAEGEPAPRLLILDWVMPGMDGTEVCRRLRSARKTQPYQYILLLTSRDAKSDTVAGLEAGADDYLTKPFDAKELLARLRAGSRILELQDRLLETYKELEYLATHDALTGLWNRLAWKKLLNAELERAHRNRMSVSVLMIDIDHFKTVNDTYGHSAGDMVLRNIGEALQSLVPSYDHAARYGGEEFIVFAQGLSPDSVHDYAERIRATLAELVTWHEGVVVSVTVSIGGVFTPVLGEHLARDCLVRLADRALYEAKESGRNCVCLEELSPVDPLPSEAQRLTPAALQSI